MTQADQSLVLFAGISIAGLLLCALVGAWVAHEKGRNEGEGFLLGFVLAVFGVLIEALLPTQGGAQ